jgi:hypothetical protein
VHAPAKEAGELQVCGGQLLMSFSEKLPPRELDELPAPAGALAVPGRLWALPRPLEEAPPLYSKAKTVALAL